jgi:uncharacterized protein (TIGR02271 family)
MNDEKELVVPVIQEDLEIGKQPVQTGTVRVRKRVVEHVEEVDMDLMHEQVEVRRVSINRAIEQVPEIRTEGATTVIPVVEEEIEIRKRLILKEEIYITRRRERSPSSHEVTVRHEEAEIARLDREGNERSPESAARFRSGSILAPWAASTRTVGPELPRVKQTE